MSLAKDRSRKLSGRGVNNSLGLAEYQDRCYDFGARPRRYYDVRRSMMLGDCALCVAVQDWLGSLDFRAPISLDLTPCAVGH